MPLEWDDEFTAVINTAPIMRRPITLDEVQRRLAFALAQHSESVQWWENWARQTLRRFDDV